MRFIETEFGEVVLRINGADYYLAECEKDREFWNVRCEEYCALQEMCHETIGPREFCRPFTAASSKEMVFITEEPARTDDCPSPNVSESQLSKMMHTIGLDNKDPKDGKYEAYRNYYDPGDNKNPDLEKLKDLGYVRRDEDLTYHLTVSGFKFLEDALHIKIEETK